MKQTLRSMMEVWAKIIRRSHHISFGPGGRNIPGHRVDPILRWKVKKNAIGGCRRGSTPRDLAGKIIGSCLSLALSLVPNPSNSSVFTIFGDYHIRPDSPPCDYIYVKSFW